jgi:hypothetical protein
MRFIFFSSSSRNTILNLNILNNINFYLEVSLDEDSEISISMDLHCEINRMSKDANLRRDSIERCRY